MTAPSEIPRTLSRRSLLKSGLLGGALVALSGVGLSFQQTRRGDATPEGLQVFSADEFAILIAVADTLCPRRGSDFPSASELGIPQKSDALFARADADLQQGFKLALRMIEHPLTGALFGERLVPFTHLDAEGRTAALRAFRESRLGVRRTVFAGVSMLVASQYWGDPRTWPRIGYEGPPSVQGLRAMYHDNLVDFSDLANGARVEGG